MSKMIFHADLHERNDGGSCQKQPSDSRWVVLALIYGVKRRQRYSLVGQSRRLIPQPRSHPNRFHPNPYLT